MDYRKLEDTFMELHKPIYGETLKKIIIKANSESTKPIIKDLNQGFKMSEITLNQIGLFYVVNSSDDGLEQITVGLNSYVAAKQYQNTTFCKLKFPNAFIVAVIKDV